MRHLIRYRARRLDEHLIRNARSLRGEDCHANGGEDVEVVGLPRQEGSSVEVHRWKLNTRRIDGFSFRPGIGLLRRALACSVGFESASITDRLLIRDMASTTFWLNAPPIVLTPMMVVGLMSSIAATKSRVGACL